MPPKPKPNPKKTDIHALTELSKSQTKSKVTEPALRKETDFHTLMSLHLAKMTDLIRSIPNTSIPNPFGMDDEDEPANDEDNNTDQEEDDEETHQEEDDGDASSQAAVSNGPELEDDTDEYQLAKLVQKDPRWHRNGKHLAEVFSNLYDRCVHDAAGTEDLTDGELSDVIGKEEHGGYFRLVPDLAGNIISTEVDGEYVDLGSKRILRRHETSEEGQVARDRKTIVKVTWRRLRDDGNCADDEGENE